MWGFPEKPLPCFSSDSLFSILSSMPVFFPPHLFFIIKMNICWFATGFFIPVGFFVVFLENTSHRVPRTNVLFKLSMSPPRIISLRRNAALRVNPRGPRGSWRVGSCEHWRWMPAYWAVVVSRRLRCCSPPPSGSRIMIRFIGQHLLSSGCLAAGRFVSIRSHQR